MRFDAFTSGFYSFPSLDAASQMCMNYYPDLVEGSLPNSGVPQGGEKARKVLTPTPGISTYCVLPKAPVRGMAAGGNSLYAVAGDTLYTVISTTPYYTAHTGGAGSVGNDGNPVQIVKSTDEAVIMSAGKLYVDGYPSPGVVEPCQFSTQLYDLVVESVTDVYPGALTGDTGGIFDLADVGSVVWITGGTVGTWNLDAYVITTVNADGSAYPLGYSTATPGLAGTCWGSPGAMEGLGYELLEAGTTNSSSTAPFLLANATVGPPDYVTASQVAYLDGTYLAAAPYTNQVFYSATESESNQPGVSWDLLNFFEKEAYPDAVIAMIADHEQLYLFGAEQSTEVWSDTGSGTNPYQRNPAYMIHYGCQAAFSVCRAGGGVAWIGGDASRGQRMAFLATGYVPQRVSTAAIEKAWNAYTTVADAVAYTIIQDGHEFWVISFPTANATWVYDATLGEWHQRGAWGGVATSTLVVDIPAGANNIYPESMANIESGMTLVMASGDGSYAESVVVASVNPGVSFAVTLALSKTGPGITITSAPMWNRHAGAFHACIGLGTTAEQHFIGDWNLGNIYTMSAAYYQDSGANIHRQRRAPHLSNERRRRFYSLFELDADDDSNSMADVNEESQRFRWLRLGASRDRIFRVDDDGNGNLTLSYSDDNCLNWTTRNGIALYPGPANLSITAAYLQFTEGTS